MKRVEMSATPRKLGNGSMTPVGRPAPLINLPCERWKLVEGLANDCLAPSYGHEFD